MKTNRQTKWTLYATLYLLVIVAVLATANFLANRYNKSFDTTANKRYSLSEQTQKIVRELQQDVTLTFFDRADRFSSAKDLLDRYANLSPRLKVEYVDPYKKPTVAREAGVKTEGTLFVQTASKREEAKSVTEEEITGALIRAIKGGKRSVCFVAGLGERSIEDTRGSGYSQLKETLEASNYEVRNISLLGGGPEAKAPEKIAIGDAAPATPAAGGQVPADCTVTVVGGPRFDYPQPAVDALKKSVESGGRVLFLIDPPLKIGREDIAENAALTGLLASWGVTLAKNLVIDLSGIGQIFGLSEAVPLITSYGSHPIVREMKDVATAMPLARSLEAKSGDKTNVEELFSTSKSSIATTNLSAAEIRPTSGDPKGPFATGAAGSYGIGSSQGRFVVVGTSGFCANNILRFNGNRDLLLNMMNWLSSDEDLISIRPKDPEDRRLTLSRDQMGLVRAVSQFVIPLLVVFAGVAVWWKRR
jgi:ABC-type uncharacterized transport system involved in gliding motility auxiliary subunit